jgi:tRNA modification GTPase
VPPSSAEARDTIAAIATAVGGGIGVIRISGPRAEAILAALIRPWPHQKTRAPSHKLVHGHVVDPITGEKIDEVLSVVMRGPHSYTAEDVAEIHGHGGPRVLQRVLEVVCRAGARMAEAGEFTRRAFELGRIDLTQAEAVAAIVAARSDRALKAAQRILAGEVGARVRELRQSLVLRLAEIEGPLDFPDERLDEMPVTDTLASLGELRARIETMAGSWVRLGQERAEVVLVGQTNAGKSSLLNALAGRERVLVDEAPGTTRDVVEVEVDLAGQAISLIDTAGERAEASTLEQRGLALARQRLERAEVALLVVDGTSPESWARDAELLSKLPSTVERVVVWNKHDLSSWQSPPATFGAALALSAATGEGLPALRRELEEHLGGGESDDARLQISARQRRSLVEAGQAIARAEQILGAGEPAEVAALEARGALHHLGVITGETADDDVLTALFARFCIGK